ncbi:MAG: ABC transporter permease [Planctomycetota bacterium]
MSLIGRLALGYLRQQRWRLASTTAAIVASAAVVVWVVAGYDALVERAAAPGEEYLGGYDAALAAHPQAPALAPELLAALAQDPDVAAAAPALQVRVPLGPAGEDPKDLPEVAADDGSYGRESAYMDGDDSARGSGRGAATTLPALVGTRAAAPPRLLMEGRWLRPEQDALEAVLSSGAADLLQAKTGGEVVVRVGERKLSLAVVGLVKQRQAASVLGESLIDAQGLGLASFGAGPAGPAVYLSFPALTKVLGAERGPNLCDLALRPGADPDAFRARWSERLGANMLLTAADLQQALGQSANARAARAQAWAATGVSLLASLFIIFSTLSMGVTERMRQLALLRALGLTRGQVARLVVLDALALAVLGWLGGLLAGWALLAAARAGRPELLGHGALGPWAVLLSGVCAGLGALCAAVLPAWTASRVDVVAALDARPARSPARWLPRATVAGFLALLCVPLVVSALPLSDKARGIAFGVVGLPALGLGFLLLAPGLVVASERAFGPLLARALALPPQLLRSQLESNLARSVGTTVALMVGLGLFVTIQVWGYTMLGPFLPGAWAPDATALFGGGDLPEAALAELARLPQVARVERLATEQPRLADDITGSRRRGQSVTRQDNVVLVGLDPETALGPTPLFDLQLLGCTRAEAAARLAQGGQCLVPDHFARETGLGVGDSFALVPPQAPERQVRYTIAGLVRLPGWHFVAKTAGLRRRLPRAAALLFTGRKDLERDFGLRPDRVELVGLSLHPGADPAALRQALRELAQRHGSRPDEVAVMSPAEVRASLETRTDALLWGVSELPLITLLVTALGVVNAILASIRSRRWELGVLRALGVTRAALVRMVVAEAALVGLVAVVGSLSFGFVASWAGVAMAQHVSFFGGLAPPVVIPWGHLAGGVSATLGLCLLAAVWPAVAIGRAEPLDLLQAGRAAA